MEDRLDYEVEVEVDELTEEGTAITKKKPVNEETLLTLNEYFRVKINNNAPSMELEKKKKYDDGTESFVNDGYFGDFPAMLKDVASTMRKEKLCQKRITDIEDLRNAILSTNKMIEEWIGISKTAIQKKLEEN
jgi:hypothetical protein